MYRDVAQLARAPALGAGGREFEPRRPDHVKSLRDHVARPVTPKMHILSLMLYSL